MFNLVIKMEKGKIYEIVWDNGCFLCEKEKCIKNIISNSVIDNSEKIYENCIIDEDIMDANDNVEKEPKDEKDPKDPKEETKPIENKKENFEPKFYITWFGTDKDKRQLKTAGLAMTKFKPYISGSFYSSVKKLFS